MNRKEIIIRYFSMEDNYGEMVLRDLLDKHGLDRDVQEEIIRFYKESLINKVSTIINEHY